MVVFVSLGADVVVNAKFLVAFRHLFFLMWASSIRYPSSMNWISEKEEEHQV